MFLVILVILVISVIFIILSHPCEQINLIDAYNFTIISLQIIYSEKKPPRKYYQFVYKTHTHQSILLYF